MAIPGLRVIRINPVRPTAVAQVQAQLEIGADLAMSLRLLTVTNEQSSIVNRQS